MPELYLVERTDAIVAAWVRAQSEPDNTGFGDARPIRELVAALGRVIAADPETATVLEARRALARAAARHGAQIRVAGEPANRVPYEHSVLVDAIWAVLGELQPEDARRRRIEARLPAVLSLAVAAGLLGYDLPPEDPAPLSRALELCCAHLG